MKEIEKKYLIKKLPNNIEKYKMNEIEQAYLNRESEPTLRIRKYNNDYFLTYKSSSKEQKNSNNYNICTEYELPISKEAYFHLRTKIDGKIIQKQRYCIPYDNYIIELDIFSGWLEGIIIAEVEFKTEEEAVNFSEPVWFGVDVTKEKKYRNSFMSSGKITINELLD